MSNFVSRTIARKLIIFSLVLIVNYSVAYSGSGLMELQLHPKFVENIKFNCENLAKYNENCYDKIKRNQKKIFYIRQVFILVNTQKAYCQPQIMIKKN